ncbi:MAG TPA: PKD domain-containing protein, partial [Ktedonobacterales bacterium]|nr:PKD domain-containing protein [Ktedonobacterales bacterium]
RCRKVTQAWQGRAGRMTVMRRKLGTRLAWLARLAGIALLATGLALALTVLTLAGQSDLGWLRAARVARACGLGNTPTMLANGAPALLYPVPQGTNIPADQPIGVFALQYVAGQTIQFNEDLSRVPGAPAPDSLKWRWQFGDQSTASSDLQPSHTFSAAGTFNVHAQIFDSYSNAWTDLDSAQIQVIGAALANPPIARATASTSAVVQGDGITFDASGSQPVVGSKLTYEWNFNDATTATGAHVTHKFSIGGAGFVALLVTDERGARSVATINIGVVSDKQEIPTAAISAPPGNASVGQSVAFDASQSTPAATPPHDQLDRYVWDFGDGSAPHTTTTPTTTHTYAKIGQYTVTLQAINQEGIPGQTTLAVKVVAAAKNAAGAGGPSWPAIGLGTLLAILLGVGGYLYYRRMEAEALRERQRAAQAQLRRAKRVPQAGVRPGDPRWGDPRAGGRVQGGPSGGPRLPPGAPGSRRNPPARPR